MDTSSASIQSESGRCSSEERPTKDRHALGPRESGIHAFEIYFPNTFVDQSVLEKHDGVGEGKYTIGLGQRRMAFCDDRQDVVSMALTVFDRLMASHSLRYDQIGWLGVGSESHVDRCKSIKTALMQRFVNSKNFDVGGVDQINACYAATASLLSAVNWVESPFWDGRWAVVIATDIAVYEKGPARPTGGCGAVALLIGEKAPIALEGHLTAHHMQHAYDFYKPKPSSEYPLVDGHFSLQCYKTACVECLRTYRSKFRRHLGRSFCLEKDVQLAAFHAPFSRLCEKGFAQMVFDEVEQTPSCECFSTVRTAQPIMSMPVDNERERERVLLDACKVAWDRCGADGVYLSKELGNLYTGSVLSGLLSQLMALSQRYSDSDVKRTPIRLLGFAYGSGYASSLVSFLIDPETDFEAVCGTADVHARLQRRVAVEPTLFEEAMDRREQLWTHCCEGTPERIVLATETTLPLDPNTTYLQSIDQRYRRSYATTAS